MPSTSRRPPRYRPRQGSAATRSAPPQDAAAAALERRFAASAAAAVTATTFAELGVPEALVGALAARGIAAPFPIQVRAVPDALAGRDVLGRGQTGSGKTLAFGLPLLARLAGGRRVSGAPRGLILVPTRELAAQVEESLAPLAAAVGLRLLSVYGGAPIVRQLQGLRRGVDVVIATPGRLMDVIERGACSLGSVMITILDEADYMADLGFLPAVTELLDATPADGQRMLFSATLDGGVDRIVRRYLNDPAAHAIATASAPVDTVDHRAFTLRADDKVAVAAELAARPARTLLFVRTKHGADRLAKQLERAGVAAGAIHGNLTQNARQRALDRFAAGNTRVLVATDVAARGIHVDDVDLVVHFDPPADHKDYLHRSGRTGRAGAKGVVLSLLLSDQIGEARRMHERAGVRPVAVAVHPGHEAVREIAASGVAVVPRPPAASRPSFPGAGPTSRNRRRPTGQGGGRRAA